MKIPCTKDVDRSPQPCVPRGPPWAQRCHRPGRRPARVPLLTGPSSEVKLVQAATRGSPRRAVLEQPQQQSTILYHSSDVRLKDVTLMRSEIQKEV